MMPKRANPRTATDLRTARSDPRYFVPVGAAYDLKARPGLRMSDAMEAEIQRLIVDGQDTGLFPWRSRSDVIRYLIVRGMETLEPQPTHIAEFLRGIEDERAIRYAETCVSEVRAFVADLRKRVMLIQGDATETAYGKAVALITAAYATAQDLQDSPWKERLVAAIEQEWRQFLT